METFETFEHAGLTVKLFYDSDPEYANPREHDGNLGVMFCDHPHYVLGDKDTPDPRPAVEERAEEIHASFEAHLVKHLQENGARVILPLFLYDHSGVSISAGGRLDTGADDFDRTGRHPFDSAGWDTSSVGVIYDTEETRKECGLADDVTDEEIERQLREEVVYYNAYLTGQVFCYAVEDADGEHLDSCGGFLEADVHSEDAYVRVQAREAAEYAAAEISKERAEAAYWLAREVITI